MKKPPFFSLFCSLSFSIFLDTYCVSLLCLSVRDYHCAQGLPMGLFTFNFSLYLFLSAGPNGRVV